MPPKKKQQQQQGQGEGAVDQSEASEIDGGIKDFLLWMTEERKKEREEEEKRREEERRAQEAREQRMVGLMEMLAKKQSDLESARLTDEQQRKEEIEREKKERAEKEEREKLERLEKEEREKRERAEREERERLERAEKEEREKLERTEKEERAMIEQQEREERDRVERESVEQERREEMQRLQLKMEEDRRAWIEEYNKANSQKVKEPILVKLGDRDDIESYLTTFERIATSYKWPDEVWSLKLAPQLTGKAQAAYANMDTTSARDYALVKKAILKRYDINEETYRQRFRNAKKRQDESFMETEVRMRDNYTKWTHSATATVTKEEICDLMIREQLLTNMPLDLQLWIRERKPGTSVKMASLADDYVLAHKATKDKDQKGDRRVQCHKCRRFGHIAKDCTTTTTGEEKKPTDGAKGSRPERADVRCYRCNQLGHIANRCSSNGKPKSGYFCGEYEFEEDREYNLSGQVEDQWVPILIDTGCSKTMVRKDLVPEEKVDHNRRIQLRCAHGDLMDYPTAKVKVKIQGHDYYICAAISSSLPRPILLGRDSGDLLELIERERERERYSQY